jgi:hypothetical protein
MSPGDLVILPVLRQQHADKHHHGTSRDQVEAEACNRAPVEQIRRCSDAQLPSDASLCVGRRDSADAEDRGGQGCRQPDMPPR